MTNQPMITYGDDTLHADSQFLVSQPGQPDRHVDQWGNPAPAERPCPMTGGACPASGHPNCPAC